MEENDSNVIKLPSWYLEMEKITKDPSQCNRFSMQSLKPRPLEYEVVVVTFIALYRPTRTHTT
jgi:hypothetical protein